MIFCIPRLGNAAKTKVPVFLLDSDEPSSAISIKRNIVYCCVLDVSYKDHNVIFSIEARAPVWGSEVGLRTWTRGV